MLEDAKNSIPEELSKRFDLNRFFALQRDVINDELSDNVPDLVEDAMENPTGSYQQVSRFQNEKLMDIDRTTIAIMEMLNAINLKVGNLEKSVAEGDGWFDDILSGLLGGLGSGLLGGRGKRTKTSKKIPKKTRPSTKPKTSKIPKINLRGNIGKIIAGLVLSGLALSTTNMFSGDETDSGEDSGVNTASLGDSILSDLAAYAAIGSVPLIASKITNMIAGPTAPPPIETATPKSGAVRRSQLPKDHPKYKAPGGPRDKFGTSSSYVSAEDAKNVKPSASPKAPAGQPGVFSQMGSYLKSSTSNALAYGKSYLSGWKSTAYIAAAYACWDFYSNISALPADMSEADYRKEVGRLARETVAITGLTMFTAFVGGLVGGMAGSFVPGAGNIAVGAIGFLSGIVSGALAEWFIGDEVRGAVNNAALAAVVDTLVGWIMDGVKLAKSVMPTQVKQNNKLARTAATDEFANLNEEQLHAKGLRRIPAKYNSKGGTSPYTEYEVTNPEKFNPSASPMASTSETGMQSATKAASQLYKNRKPETKKSSFLDWMNPGSMVASMAGSMFGATGGEFASGLSGMVNNPGVTAMAQGLSSSDIFGGAGMGAILGMAGVKALTPDDAAAMGMSPEDAAKFNSQIKPQTVSQSMTPGAGREVNAALAKADPLEGVNTAIASMGEQFNAANRLTLAQPAATTRGFPQFASTPHPTSTAIVALRAQGMADVYVHPQSGATMERMDRGGETLFG